MSAIIMLESVIKNYVMGKTIVRALRGIDLAVEEAEFVSIACPSRLGRPGEREHSDLGVLREYR